jgi:peptidoglycan/LPS O-acetylase OafA/YrhL
MPVIAKSSPGSTTDAVRPGKRMRALDGLRAISIAAVLLGHLSGTRGFPQLEIEPVIGDYANLGVVMFFVISGFLITTLLLEEYQQFGDISLRLFYARRVLRLFPAFLLYMIFLMTVERLGWIRLNPGDLLAALTYTVNFRQGTSWYIGHLWSLSVEEQFYLLWPAVLVVAGCRRAVWVAGAMMLISPVARLFAVQHHVPGSIFPCVADSLACGCLLALCGDRLRLQAWYVRLIASPYFVPMAVFLILLCSRLRVYLIGIVLGIGVINILMSAIVHRCVLMRSKVSNFLAMPVLVGVGVLSYSLYLWQQFFLNRYASWAICRFPLNIVLAMLAASASYYFVERPLNGFRKKLRRER